MANLFICVYHQKPIKDFILPWHHQILRVSGCLSVCLSVCTVFFKFWFIRYEYERSIVSVNKGVFLKTNGIFFFDWTFFWDQKLIKTIIQRFFITNFCKSTPWLSMYRDASTHRDVHYSENKLLVSLTMLDKTRSETIVWKERFLKINIFVSCFTNTYQPYLSTLQWNPLFPLSLYCWSMH